MVRFVDVPKEKWPGPRPGHLPGMLRPAQLLVDIDKSMVDVLQTVC